MKRIRWEGKGWEGGEGGEGTVKGGREGRREEGMEGITKDGSEGKESKGNEWKREGERGRGRLKGMNFSNTKVKRLQEKMRKLNNSQNLSVF